MSKPSAQPAAAKKVPPAKNSKPAASKPAPAPAKAVVGKPASKAASPAQAKKAGPAAKSAAPKPAAKPVGKPPTKPAAKAAPAVRAAPAAAKPSSKTTAKPAASPATQPSTGTKASVNPKSAAVPAAVTPVAADNLPVSKTAHAAEAASKAAKAAPAAAAPATPTPPTAPTPAATPALKSSSKSKTPPAAMVQPIPAPLPINNRFTDRFAPAAKPTSRPMSETAEFAKPAQKIDPKLANAWKTKAGRELTEAELLAMPESEYMNEKQLDFFRARLQQHRDDLLSNAGETTEHLREDTTIVPDPADRATIEEEHALELRTRDRERKLLKKVAQAIALLDTGEYGYCDETGEPIGLPRLLARPTATLSLEAQQRRELKQKMFGN